VLVDYRVHFVKSGGGTTPRVFKMKSATLAALAALESLDVSARISLRQMTTRKHYPGVHKVEAILNGRPLPLGTFLVTAARRSRKRR
jgi:hypothetical protein